MPKPLPDELYHYTGIQGLKGIVESQTLWATHYKYLNDAEEISHFRDRLPDILRPVFESIFSKPSPQQEQLLIKEYGSTAAALEKEPKKLADVMYDTTFHGMKGDAPFAEPYITSFCTVEKGDNYIANHGLLSQWRGYGTQGGYAIIFDTDGLIQLQREEGKRNTYSLILTGDIVYSSATDDEVRDEFREHIDTIQKNWAKTFRTQDSKDLGDIFNHFIACACLYKHWGFAEERECRIVAIPSSRQVIEFAKRKRSQSYRRNLSVVFCATEWPYRMSTFLKVLPTP